MDRYSPQRNDYIILSVILIIAVASRTVNLDNSLWYDEIFTVINYLRLSVIDLLTGHSTFNNHTFYSLQATFIISLFGESNAMIRLPALIFGVACIPVIWRIAFNVSGRLQAHISAFLIALSYHHVWFSQNARGYTELMFWCVISTLVIINCLRKPSWRGWVIYGLIVAAGMYTHLTAAIFFLTQALIVAFIILFKKAPYFSLHSQSGVNVWLMPFTGFLIGGLLTLILYFPTLIHLFDAVMNVQNTSAVDLMKEYQSPIWALLEIISSVARPNAITMFVALLTLILTAIGMGSIYKKEPLIPVLLLLHIILLLGILLALSMRVWPRFFFLDMGFILLFITQGVFVCCQKISQFLQTILSLKMTTKFLFIFSSVLMLLISSVLLLKNYQNPKQDFEGSLQYISEQKKPTDHIVTMGLASIIYNDYYNTDWTVVESVQDIQQAETDFGKTWLIMIFPTRTQRVYADEMQYINVNYSLVKTVYGTDVLVCISIH